MAKTRNGKARKRRAAFALSQPKTREPNGRESRAGQPRRTPPTKELMRRREVLGLQPGDMTESWIAVGHRNGMLTEDQRRAIEQYQSVVEAYRRAMEAPQEAPDILATMLPRSGGGTIPEDALKAIREHYFETHAALNNASRKESEALQRYICKSALPLDGDFRLIGRAADWLVDHFGFARSAA